MHFNVLNKGVQKPTETLHLEDLKTVFREESVYSNMLTVFSSTKSYNDGKIFKHSFSQCLSVHEFLLKSSCFLAYC